MSFRAGDLRFSLLIACLLAAFLMDYSVPAQKRRRATNARTTPAVLTITAEPNATVWIDDVRRGTIDGSGKLILTKISPGRHSLRVRADGFNEVTRPLLSTGGVIVKLV